MQRLNDGSPYTVEFPITVGKQNDSDDSIVPVGHGDVDTKHPGWENSAQCAQDHERIILLQNMLDAHLEQ